VDYREIWGIVSLRTREELTKFWKRSRTYAGYFIVGLFVDVKCESDVGKISHGRVRKNLGRYPLGGNDFVQISMWPGGGTRSAECCLVTSGIYKKGGDSPSCHAAGGYFV